MDLLKLILFFTLILVLNGCEKDSKVKVIKIANSAAVNSCCSNVHTDSDGNTYLSWIEEVGDSTSILKLSKFENDVFDSAEIVAEGDNWFTNWADFPEVYSFSETKQLIAHWLQKSADGSYDYDIRYTISDVNDQWSDSEILHQDDIAAEHGFVSYTHLDHQVMALWLDGRNMKKESKILDNSEHGHGHGAMTLRSAIIANDGAVSQRKIIDPKVCECCQTDLTTAQDGIYAVYRNRDDTEHRDIYFSKYSENRWSEPNAVNMDHWKVYGCPVNGPAIDAYKDQMAVAWFTAANDQPAINFAFFDFTKQAFSEHIQIAQSSEVLGRVDVEIMSKNKIVVSWMQKSTEDRANINISIIENKILQNTFTAKETSASRKSGFPILSKYHNDIILSYTNVDSIQKIETCLLNF